MCDRKQKILDSNAEAQELNMGRQRTYQVPRLTSKERARLRAMSTDDHESELKRRRAQIYLLAAAGWSNAEIAHQLAITCVTVIKHLKLCQHQSVMQAMATPSRRGRSYKISSAARHWVRTVYLNDNPTDSLRSARWTMRSLHAYITTHAKEHGFPELADVCLATIWHIVHPGTKPTA